MGKILRNPKFKNPVFWASLIAVIFGSAGVDFNTLTSWDLLYEAVKSIFDNPVAIMAVMIAVTGVFNDNSKKGIDKLT